MRLYTWLYGSINLNLYQSQSVDPEAQRHQAQGNFSIQGEWEWRISQFIKSGKQYIGVSTGAYLAAKTIRWQQRTWEYPLKYYRGMAEGPLAELATWPAAAQVDLEPTADGHQRGLTTTLLAACQYHGGPRFVNGRGHQVLANYPDKTAAIVSKKIGRGEVLLIGVEVSPAASGKNGSQFLLNLLKNP